VRVSEFVVADCNAKGVITGMSNRSVPGVNSTVCMSQAVIVAPADIDAFDETLGCVFG
jgi:taurine-pyruvate aminotransferase